MMKNVCNHNKIITVEENRTNLKTCYQWNKFYLIAALEGQWRWLQLRFIKYVHTWIRGATLDIQFGVINIIAHTVSPRKSNTEREWLYSLVLILALFSWCITGVVSGFSLFSITIRPRNVRSFSTSDLQNHERKNVKMLGLLKDQSVKHAVRISSIFRLLIKT